MSEVLLGFLCVFAISCVASSLVTFSVDSVAKGKKKREKKIRSLHLLALAGDADAEKEWQDHKQTRF